MKLEDLPDVVEHFRKRVLQDALTEATAAYWNRRAEQFAAVGNERCDEVAKAFVASATNEKPVMKVAAAGLIPISPVTVEAGTVEMAVLASTT